MRPLSFSLCLVLAACQPKDDAASNKTEKSAKSEKSEATSSAKKKVPVSASAAPTGDPSAAASATSAPVESDPFAFFDGAPPAFKPIKRSARWPYGETAPILPEWENFAERSIQRKDRSAFFVQWNINATPFTEKILATHAKLVPMRATGATLGKIEEKRAVGKVPDARVGLGKLTIDGETASVWFAEIGVKCSKPGVESSDRLVWVFVAKDASAAQVFDEGRYLMRSITPVTDCSDL